MSMLVNARNLFVDINLDGPSIMSTRARKQIQELQFTNEQSYIGFLWKLNRLLNKACLERKECLRVIKKALPPGSPLGTVESLQEFGDRLESFDQWVNATKWAESKQRTRKGLLTTMLMNKKANKLRRYRGKRGARRNRK